MLRKKFKDIDLTSRKTGCAALDMAYVAAGRFDGYFQENLKDKSKFVPEGVEGRVEYKGKVSKIIYQLQGGLRSSMGYIGAKNLKEISKKANFIKITKNN